MTGFLLSVFRLFLVLRIWYGRGPPKRGGPYASNSQHGQRYFLSSLEQKDWANDLEAQKRRSRDWALPGSRLNQHSSRGVGITISPSNSDPRSYRVSFAHVHRDQKAKQVAPRSPWQASESGRERIHDILCGIKWPQGITRLCKMSCFRIASMFIYTYTCIRTVHAALNTAVPCPHCKNGYSSFTSYHWHQLCGGLGVHLMSPAISGIKTPQAEALCGLLRLCGMMRLKVVDPNQRPLKQTHAVEVLVMCEARLPLFMCRMTRHLPLHFWAKGGWAEDLAVATGMQK